MSKINKFKRDVPVHTVKLSKILSKKQFFHGVPASQIALAINTCSETVTKKEGGIICKQGENSFDLFMLMEGKCDVIFEKNKVAEIKAVDTIGEIGFITGEKRSATVIAKKPCNLIVFNKKLFDEFLKKDREISEIIYKNVIQILSKRITKSNKMVGWLTWI